MNTPMDLKSASPSTSRELNTKQKFLLLTLPVFGLVAALLIFEILFRLFSPTTHQKVRGDRPSVYYRTRRSPNFQGNVYSTKKPDNTFRIAVVGDSISFGPHLQIDDTFPARLQRMINVEAEGAKAEVVNYGVPGYSTFHEVNSVKTALAEEADLVVLQITLNDPEITPLEERHEAALQRFGPFVPTPFQKSLFSYWRSLGFVVERLHNSNTRKAYREYFFDLFKDEKTRSLFESSIRQIAELCKARQVKLVAVIFPLFAYPLDEAYPFKPIHQQVNEILKANQIPALDLFKTYKYIPLERLHVIPWKDIHPGEAAHRLAAESIYTWLYKRKLLSQKLFPIPNTYSRRTAVQELRIGG